MIDFAGTEWQKALERGTKSPWTWHFTTLGLHMEPVSASRLFEPLRESGQAPVSVENRSGAECLYKGTDDSRVGNANDLLWPINRTYISGLKDAHDLWGDLVTLRIRVSAWGNLMTKKKSAEVPLKLRWRRTGLNYLVLIFSSFPGSRTFLLWLILRAPGTQVRSLHSHAVTHWHSCVHSRHMGVCVICCHGIDLPFYLAATDLCVCVCICVYSRVCVFDCPELRRVVLCQQSSASGVLKGSNSWQDRLHLPLQLF